MFMFLFMFMPKLYVNAVSDRNEVILGFVVISLSVFHLQWSDRIGQISWKSLLHRNFHASRQQAQNSKQHSYSQEHTVDSSDSPSIIVQHPPEIHSKKLICTKYFISLSFQIRLEFWFVEQTENDNRNKNKNEKHENNNEKLNHHNIFGMWFELEVVRLRNSSRFLFSRKSHGQQALKWSYPLDWLGLAYVEPVCLNHICVSIQCILGAFLVSLLFYFNEILAVSISYNKFHCETHCAPLCCDRRIVSRYIFVIASQ